MKDYVIVYFYVTSKHCVCKKDIKGVYQIVAECYSRDEALSICEKLNG